MFRKEIFLSIYFKNFMPLNLEMKLVVMPPHAFFPQITFTPIMLFFFFTKLNRSIFAFKTPVSQYMELPTFFIYTINDLAQFFFFVKLIDRQNN